MFRVTPLAEGEAAPLEGQVTLSADRRQLLQRCGALDDACRCRVYAVRPGICRRYRCLALAGFESKRMTYEEAKELVDEVLSRRRALAAAMGLTDGQAAFAQARAEDDAKRFPPRDNADEVATALARLRRALLILQLSPDDPILAKRQ